MVEDYFEDVSVFLVNFTHGQKVFKRTIIVPYSWSDKEVQEYLQNSFQQVSVLKVTLIDFAWVPNSTFK